MNIFTSLIFNRSVLGLLVGACVIIFIMNVYLDNSRERIIDSTALIIAKENADLISQIGNAYKHELGAQHTPNATTLVNLINAKLNETGNKFKIQVINQSSQKDEFQTQALVTLTTRPDKPFYKTEEVKGYTLMRYAISNTAFKNANDSTPSILEIDVPMNDFENIENRETINILWAMVLLAILATISLVIFLGRLRTSAEVLAETQAKALSQQKRLTQAYERFFPHRFLELLRKKSILDIQLGDAVEKKMSILFADIRNFTTILETKSPTESFQFINSYMGKVGPLVREYNGFIDKYIGDAIMALFEEPPDNALNAAIKILELLIQSTEKTLITPDELIEIGIGIHYGSLMAGTVGEKKRMDGTVIGDTVNTASRLESLNKLYHTHIIVSEDFLKHLQHKDAFKIRFIDHIYLRGKAQDIKIYEIFDIDAPELIEKKMKIMDAYEAAISCYYDRQFEKAMTHLQYCQKILPDDQIISMHIMRCAKLIREGVSEDWEPITKYFRKSDYE